ncbi:MAG: hypothetical protein WCI57_04340 [Candidatus Berkelbacteria bacterium]
MIKNGKLTFRDLHDKVRNLASGTGGSRFETMDGLIYIYEHPLGNIVVEYRYDEYKSILIFADDTVCMSVPSVPATTRYNSHVEKTIVTPADEEILQLLWLLERSEPNDYNPDETETGESPDDYLIYLRRIHRHVDQLPICEVLRKQGLKVFTEEYASLVGDDEYAHWFVLTAAKESAKDLSESKVIITWRNTVRLLEVWDDVGNWHVHKLGYEKVVDTIEKILVEKFSKESQ